MQDPGAKCKKPPGRLAVKRNADAYLRYLPDVLSASGSRLLGSSYKRLQSSVATHSTVVIHIVPM